MPPYFVPECCQRGKIVAKNGDTYCETHYNEDIENVMKTIFYNEALTGETDLMHREKLENLSVA